MGKVKFLSTLHYFFVEFVVYPYFPQLLIETPRNLRDPSFDFQFPGGLIARVTPVPIPNTEVKPC